MLGLGNTIQSSVDSRKSVWNPDDDVTENLLGLKIWLTARDEDLELAGTRVVSWSDRANNITFSQNTAAKRPLWTAANQEITFLVTSTADYLQGDTATVLDTSNNGWTAAMYVSNTDWDEAGGGSDQVIMGDDGGNNDMIKA